MTTVQPQRAGFSVQRLSRVDRLLARYVQGGHLAGALGLIYRKGETAYCNAFGHRELETGQPMTEDTIFRIYSMTKPITAVAALMLFEDGRFLLDDPVATYLPEFEDVQVCTGDLENLVPPDRTVTLKDLFMHTAGLSYGWGEDSPVEKLYRENIGNREHHSLKNFVQNLAELPLLYHPGTRWRYSFATDVLGRVVEVLSGKSLDDFFQQEIFKPLAMNDTAFHVHADSIERFSACYRPLEGFNMGGDLGRKVIINAGQSDDEPNSQPKIELHEASHDGRFTKPPDFLSGGGGLVSTLGDYLRFSQLLLNRGTLDGNRLLGPKTVELMSANHLTNDLIPIGVGPGALLGYGFGLG